MFLILCTLFNHGLHLYQVSRKYLDQFQSCGVDTISIFIITKENNIVQIVHGVTFLVLCISSNHGLHLYQFSQNVKRFQSYGAHMISILFNTKGHNSINTAHRVTVLVLCTLSNHGLHL